MSAPLLIKQRSVGDVTVLELSGHLVFDEGDRAFREQVMSLVSAGRGRLLVDLKDVTYMDSGGVGGLVAMFLHVLKRGGRLKLLCPSERACRVLKMTQLLSVFEVFQTEEQGIASFGLPVAAAAAFPVKPVKPIGA
jgi:anti-sigma B factor antagonist